VFVCPKLMMPCWGRLLHNMDDVVMMVPVGPIFFPLSMHAPLAVGLIFLLIPHRPWRLGGTPRVLEMEHLLSRLFKNHPEATGRILRQLCLLLGELPCVSERMAWKMI